MADQSITRQIMTYFGFEKVSDFSREWRQLTDQDKEDIRSGITNKTYTY